MVERPAAYLLSRSSGCIRSRNWSSNWTYRLRCRTSRSRTGGSPLLCSGGAPAPYNGTPAHSLDTRRAQGAGFSFSPLQSWLPGLLDRCILEAQRGLQP